VLPNNEEPKLKAESSQLTAEAQSAIAYKSFGSKVFGFFKKMWSWVVSKI